MKNYISKFLVAFLVIGISGCKNADEKSLRNDAAANSVKYANGIAIYEHEGFSIVKVANPWPKATKDYTYILQKKNGIIPDSLKQFIIIQVPVKSIVVTSTTHIPSLEMLGVENTLTGFPNTDFISSEKVRKRIESKMVRELGSNQSMNTEVVIDLNPDVIIGYGIDNNNQTLDNLQKSGLKILLNGDWNEQTPLGKAEWIKLFGALYGLEEKANQLFSNIEKEYLSTLELAKKTTSKPTVLAGAMYEDQWYLPQGNSWGSQFIKQAGGSYLWSETNGTGSLSLPFETVFEKAQKAQFWIGPGQFTSLAEMLESNPHYNQFDAFKSKNIYSFSTKKGKTGGLIYFELAPNRPDIVLKDMTKILHPELLPNHELYFFEKLN